MRYKKTYQYDPVFALGFVTVYDQLMDGYPNNEDRDAIFKAYIRALNEDPELYRFKFKYRVLTNSRLQIFFWCNAYVDNRSTHCRSDARKLEEWSSTQNADSLVQFSSKEGGVEDILKNIAERAGSQGNFSYSRFFAIGLFRLLEMANATEPVVLEKVDF